MLKDFEEQNKEFSNVKVEVVRIGESHEDLTNVGLGRWN